MALLFESEKYGSIDKPDTETNEFYVIMFTSESYTLQDTTKTDGQVITVWELVVKTQYLCSMQVDTHWYWNKHQQQNIITVPTHTILHP